MIRFIVNAAVYMAAAAIGLIVADAVLADFSVTYPAGVIVAALLFGLIQALITPLFEKITTRNASVLTGGVGLFSALVALIATAAISDDVAVTGFTTWLLAALVIWLSSMIASFILSITVAKRFIKEVRD